MADELLLDVSRLVWRAWDGGLPTGIDRTCLAYLAHYRGRALAVVQRGGITRVLDAALSQRLFDVLLDGRGDVRKRLIAIGVRTLASTQPRLPAGMLYLNVGHTGLNWPGHGAWIERTRVRPVYFVHDLIPLSHPEYCRPGEAEKHLKRLQALLAHGVGVIANSRDTLNELGIFAGLQAGRRMPPGLVAPLGVEPGFTRQAPTPSGQAMPARPYFAMIGTIEGRKNHLLMLTLWADLARRLGSACPQLVIIGKRGWESEQAVDMLERCEAIHGHVIEVTRCDDAMLRAYIAGARALLFPSFVEGYGLPLVEALACGTPVIASDLAVFRELAGDMPDYLSPIDGLGWTRAIEDYAVPNSAARLAQQRRIEGYRAPDWAGHFALVDRWLAALP